MNNKALQVRTATLTDQCVQQPQQRSGDRLDQFLQQWLEDDARGGGTISDILQHPQVKKHGFLGRLSGQQQSLVTSVVSIMQDKSARDARHHANTLRQIIVAEREALKSLSGSFAETARSLYRLPLLGASRSGSRSVDVSMPLDIEAEPIRRSAGGAPPADEPPAGRSTPNAGGNASQGFLQRYLTWGNLIAGTAIVLAVLVVKTSVETANFETQYKQATEQLEKTQATLRNVQTEFRDLETSHRNLSERHAGFVVRLEETEKQWLATQIRSDAEREQWETERVQLREALDQERLNLASAQLTLRADIAALEQTLAVYRSKENHQDEHYQLWKQLAEERQVEITRLQSEIVAIAAPRMSAPAPEVKNEPPSRFFRFF